MSAPFDCIILGAGAAGLMAAMRAGQRGRRVLLLDHAEAPGKKILISGGRRCNFTNLECRPERFLSANPHFVRSALARYTQHDFIALVAKHRIAFHEKTLGQLFCDGSARQIVAMLMAECAAAGVEIRLGQRVTEVARDTAFRVALADGTRVTAPGLVLATGGPAIPKMGATGFAYDVARQFGLPVVPPRPALVPLTFEGDDLALMRPLAGVALPCRARAAAGPPSRRRCCSPIAASPGRRCCRSPPTGGRPSRSRSICCPMWRMRRRCSARPSAPARGPSRARRWRSICRSASRGRWPSATCRPASWPRLPTATSPASARC